MYQVFSIFSHTNKKKKAKTKRSAGGLKTNEALTILPDSNIKVSQYPKSLLPSDLEARIQTPSKDLSPPRTHKVLKAPKLVFKRKSSNKVALGLQYSQVIPKMLKTPRKERLSSSKPSTRRTPKHETPFRDTLFTHEGKHLFEPLRISTTNIAYLKLHKSPKYSKSSTNI